MAGRLYRMAKVVSANPASWGIVDANQISGFRTVAKLTDLYSIAACILSSAYGDGTTTGADAVGQIWHVQEDNSDYRLINWTGRGKAEGWEKVPTANEIFTAFDDEITPVILELNEKDKTLENSINSLKSKIDENKSLIDINTLNTFWVLNHFGKSEGFATLDTKGFVPLSQLGNLDTTLFEVVSELPSTIATIKKHIYLKTAGTTGDKNNYAEYIYTGDLTAAYDDTKWEKLGEVTASVDLSSYYTKAEIDTKVNAINDSALISAGISVSTSSSDIFINSSTVTDLTDNAVIPIVTTTDAEYVKGHNGLMSPTMLTKLNSLTNYTHPKRNANASAEHGLYKITVDDLGHVSKTTAVDKSDIASLAPDLTMTPKYSNINVSVIAHYNGNDKTATIAEASNDNAGVMSTSMYAKLHAIADGATRNEVKNEVTATGTDAVSGKAVYNHVYNYKIHGDNIDNEINGSSYTIVARSDDDNTVTCLTDELTLNYDVINHSNLVVDGAVVWDEDNLKAITDDELTKILV